MADAAAEALGKMDGRDPNQPNYPPYQWTGVTHYQEWALGLKLANRPQGGDNGAPGGSIWWSPSDVDHNTVTSEILTKKYHGQTIMHMLAGLFAVFVEGHDPADVRAALGLPDVPLGLKVTAKQDVYPIQASE